jgi:hypothetical protein
LIREVLDRQLGLCLELLVKLFKIHISQPPEHSGNCVQQNLRTPVLEGSVLAFLWLHSCAWSEASIGSGVTLFSPGKKKI